MHRQQCQCFMVPAGSLIPGLPPHMLLLPAVSGGTTPGPAPPPAANWQTELLNLVNNARRSAGLRTLTLESRLNTAAQLHSEDQARRQQMTHTGSDGSSVSTRVSRAGYRWSAVAENVAAGYTSASSVHTGWMNSPGHRANIMNGRYVHMGVGLARANNGVLYWTQVFAAP